jgi:hypothetical protein
MKAVVTPFLSLFLLLLLLTCSSATVVGNDSTDSTMPESVNSVATNTTATPIDSNASETTTNLVNNNTVNPSPAATLTPNSTDNMDDSISDDDSTQVIPTAADVGTTWRTNHTELPIEKDPPHNYPIFLIGGFLGTAIVLCGVTLKRGYSKRTHYESIATELIV